MRIGIVTVQDAANYGAYLQGYALKRTLEELGYEVKFYNWINKNIIRNQFYSLVTKNLIKQPIIQTQNNKYGFSKLQKFKTAWKQFEPMSEKNVDLYILGSDEIWNINNGACKELFLYGGNLKAKRVISYAPSCAKATPSDFAGFEENVNSLRKLDEILVRDIHTQNVIAELTGRESKVVCDPTILWDFSTDKNIGKTTFLNKPYMLIYSYEYSDKLQEYIKRFSKEENIAIVAMNVLTPWADYNYNCSPLEFPGVVANADYVVTTSLHCSVFSLKANRKFVVAPSGQKVRDLVTRYGAEDAIISSEGTYEEFKNRLLNSSLDYNVISEKMSEDRRKSLELLKNSVKLES